MANGIPGMDVLVKLKTHRSHYNPEFIDGNLMNFIWRRNNAGHLWDSLLLAMRDIVYD